MLTPPPKVECNACRRLTLFPWWADRDGSPVQVCADCLHNSKQDLT